MNPSSDTFLAENSNGEVGGVGGPTFSSSSSPVSQFDLVQSDAPQFLHEKHRADCWNDTVNLLKIIFLVSHFFLIFY